MNNESNKMQLSVENRTLEAKSVIIKVEFIEIVGKGR